MAFSDNGKGSPNLAPQLSLVEEQSQLVDEMRQMQTDAGLRPYRVFSVIVEWDSGELYRGKQRVVGEKEFLPTPLVDLRPMYTNMREAGVFEHGDIVLREVSPSLTEAQVGELFFNGAKLPPGQQGYIEVRHDARKGNEPPRRRFTVRGVPWHDAERFQWIATLSDEEPDRLPNGDIVEKTTNPPNIYRPT